VITITLKGYIKRGPLTRFKQQKRGGKGKTSIKTRDEDSVVQIFSVNSHTPVMFFLHKDWFIRSRLGKFLKVRDHQKEEHYLIFYL
jgi:DNA gyrase/topoisomerase IV subunit A